MRLPLMVISAYAKQKCVSHVRYETGSVLRFVEDRFGLARLAASDARSTSPEFDCFDFTKPPRPYTVVKTTHTPEELLRSPLRAPAAARWVRQVATKAYEDE